MTLYEECLEALGDNKEVLTISETRKYHEQLGESFSFTSWGRIKWDEVTTHRSIDYAEDIDEWLIENKID
ncbi:hypothetical protein HRF54_13445, partial [Bacillus subtilis]|nr:hypothetical protein [Bacillus subtilis]